MRLGAVRFKARILNGRQDVALGGYTVEHPAARLKDGQAIASDMQLKQGLDVAFLNRSKNFDDAQTSCASLGAGWHAPLSNIRGAAPRAWDNSDSLEAVGSYFKGSGGVYGWYWSSSTVSDNTFNAWLVNLAYGRANDDDGSKSNSLNVVCVRP